ncbi:MAG: hypothetical protein JKY81_09220 [Colwellia sp.]|nr:hypothetical protein [Colwellia sp.]
MDTKILSMDLSEEQESELEALFDDTKDKFNEVIGNSVTIDNKLRDINRLLGGIN